MLLRDLARAALARAESLILSNCLTGAISIIETCMVIPRVHLMRLSDHVIVESVLGIHLVEA